MSDEFADLQPAVLWKYFLELSRIPRPSKHEGAAADWVAEQGRALGLVVERDEVGNVLLRKPAAPGQAHRVVVAMQAHVDMVCEKNEGTVHDFLVDPIRVRRDGDFLRATGTTLGADNGIGVAAGLAILAADDLAHGPLELLVTMDEETGLTGANRLQPGWLKASTLLNLDSEEEGYVTIGCAGGVDSIATRPVTWEVVPAARVGLRIKVAGLKGGHSGIDIHSGRGNAIQILAATLRAVRSRAPIQLAEVRGGNKRNAIPREASAWIAVEAADVAAVEAVVAGAERAWRDALGAFDPGLSLSVEVVEVRRAMSAADVDAIVDVLVALPHGVAAMSPSVPGLVQTSTNLGVVQTTDQHVEVNLLTRSAIESSKAALADRIDAVCRLAGFGHALVGGYPGWKPEPGAPIVGLIRSVWEEQEGGTMKVMAIHAGLECGLIGEKYPGVQMASIGPSMWDVHTPDEHVSISSTERFFRMLRTVIERA